MTTVGSRMIAALALAGVLALLLGATIADVACRIIRQEAEIAAQQAELRMLRVLNGKDPDTGERRP